MSSTDFKVLGTRVHAVQIPGVVNQMERWIEERDGCHFIAVTGMHGVTEARHDASFKQILNAADLVVPDGMPLVWLGRWHGHALRRRVYGPELMQTFCRLTGPKYRHFFYGGLPDVSNLLASKSERDFGIKVAGVYSPPFRDLSPSESETILNIINEANPDVVWVGLSTPKQEKWMYRHRSKLRVPLLVGVGAAFDINTGSVRQAPRFMREHGLEWFFRLVQEPKRLWRRYLVYGLQFTWNAGLEILGIREYH